MMAPIFGAVSCSGEVDSRPSSLSSTFPTETLHATETMSIGTVSGTPEETLDRVSSGFLDQDGKIFISHGVDSHVREYGVDGSFRSSIGRKGQGPGEFWLLQWIAAFGSDSIVAYDGGESRISIFGKDGGFGRSLEILGAGLAGQQPTSMLVMDDRYVVMTISTGITHVTLADVGEVLRDSVVVVKVDTRNEEEAVELSRVPNMWWRKLPSTTSYEIRALSTGPFAIVAMGDSMILQASNDDPSIEILEHDGTLRGEWRFSDIPFVEDSEESTGLGRRFFDQILVSNEDEVWIAETFVDDENLRRWHRLDSEGQQNATMMLPASLRVWQISDRTVLGRLRDSFGVEYVKLYRY